MPPYPFKEGDGNCVRHFLPGVHCTGVDSSNQEYGGNTINLWKQKLGAFLALHGMGTDQTGLNLNAGNHLQLYCEFKDSYLAKGRRRYRFNRACRRGLWGINGRRKKSGRVNLYESWFFVNLDDYDAYAAYPDLREFLRMAYPRPHIDNVRNDYTQLRNAHQNVADMINMWMERVFAHKYSTAYNYSRYAEPYKAIFS